MLPIKQNPHHVTCLFHTYISDEFSLSCPELNFALILCGRGSIVSLNTNKFSPPPPLPFLLLLLLLLLLLFLLLLLQRVFRTSQVSISYPLMLRYVLRDS